MARVTINARLTDSRQADAKLVLPFDLRQRSRLLAELDTREEVGLVLDRGTILRGGDRLLASDGRVIEVVAAAEAVSIVRTRDAARLARAAYHLGNRHVAVQVGAGWLRYLHDHVLDDMVRGLGFDVGFAELPFEPEAGAYAHAGHGHGHDHSQAGHSHPHGHG